MRDLVLVGGGHSHVAVLKAFGVRPPTDARLTLISRDALTPSSGMLPGYLTGDYSEAESHIDLRRLSRFAGARLCQTAAAGLDLANRLVQCEGRPPVAFDLLSIDIGSSPSSGAIAGAEHALPVKPVRGFIDGWAEIERRILVAGGPFRLLIIGGGVGGIELCLSLQHRLRGPLAARDGGPIGINFAIVTDSAVPLPQHSPALRARVIRLLRDRGVTLHTGLSVRRLERGSADCQPDRDIGFDAAILATHASAAAWLRQTGLALDDGGFIRVDGTLRSLSHPPVFAAGDIAAVEGHVLAKAGVYAVRQGPVLAANLRAILARDRLRAYRPQRRALALISTGDRQAIASYGPLAWQGAWVWQLKDWIDHRWIRRYQMLPA